MVLAEKLRKWDGDASVLLYFPLFPNVQKVENSTKKVVTQAKNKSEETGGRRRKNHLPSLFSFFLGRSLPLSDSHTLQLPSHSSPVSGEALSSSLPPAENSHESYGAYAWPISEQE